MALLLLGSCLKIRINNPLMWTVLHEYVKYICGIIYMTKSSNASKQNQRQHASSIS